MDRGNGLRSPETAVPAQDGTAVARVPSERRRAAVLGRLSSVVVVLDGDGAVEYVTPNVERLLGHRPDALAGAPVGELLHPDDSEAVLDLVGRAALRGATLGPALVRAGRRDGTAREVEVMVHGLVDDPAVAGIVVELRPVGARGADRSLRLQCSRAHSWLTLAGATSEEEAARACVRALCSLAGWAAGRFSPVAADGSLAAPTVACAEDGNRPAADPAAAPPDAAAQVLAGETTAWVADIRPDTGLVADPPAYRTSVAVAVPVDDRVSAVLELFSPAGGAPEPELLRLLEDAAAELGRVVGRIRATAALRARVDRLDDLFEEAGLGIVVVGPDLRFVRVNGAGERILGHSRDELAGLTMTDITHPEDRQASLDHADYLLRGGPGSLRLEKRCLTGTGEVVWVGVTASSVRDDDGRLLFGMGIIEDVSERKRAEASRRDSAVAMEQAFDELQAAVDLKDHLLAVTNHELRTPLTSILGLAATLELRWDVLSEADKRALVSRVERQSRRLWTLVEDLLTLASAEGGGLELEVAPVDVAAAIQDAVARAGMDVIGVPVSCPPGLRVLADPSRLSQIVGNYLANARKYGEAPVTVDARAEGDRVEIRVADAGPGVPEAFVPRLFEKFSQARSRTDGDSGTGLGLAIVRELVAAHGGDAWYEPVAPRGACFAVRLAAAPASAPS